VKVKTKNVRKMLKCTSGVQSQRKPRDAAVKYNSHSRPTFIILGPTKGSGTEDKSLAEKSGN